MIQHTTTGNIKGQPGTFTFTWVKTKDFSKIKPITQVYGLCFDDQGNLCIVNVKSKKFPGKSQWLLPGGTPENNETFEQTLIREVDEEADLDLTDMRPLGYQKVDHLETGEVSYQLRYFARIEKVKPQTLDPASGKMNERVFISPKDFQKYCPWGPVGEEILRLATEEFKKYQE